MDGIARPCALAAALLVVACSHGQPSPEPQSEQRVEGRFGTVAVYAPVANKRGLVFALSGTSGWNGGLDRAAAALAAAGAAVVGVDLRDYLRGLSASDDGCHYVISEIEDLSKRLQHELAFPEYRTPILAGVGAGGTLAYAALAQAPAATVAGAVSIDPTPTLATRVPLCAGAPSEPAPGGGFRYGPAKQLPGWWELSPPGALPATLRGLATPMPGEGDPADRLVELVRAALPAALPTAAPASAPQAPAREATAEGSLGDLPLVELPAGEPGDVMAVIYSGDGGWRDIDKQIGELLAERGIPVVGVDSLRYFWRRKSPEEVAHDLARIIARYTTLWRTPKVALIGYSFGAGILPFAYNRLPAADRSRVVLVSLLGIEHRAPFEFTMAGWLGAAPATDTRAVLPEVARFPKGLLQCVYGEGEEDTLCRDPALEGAEIIGTSGGHHFDGDYRDLAERIATTARRRARPER
jgi:type IV secretory pathway VirJ component